MATDKVILRDSKKAGEELLTKQFTLVKITEEDTLVAAASGDKPFALLDTPKTGEWGAYALVGIVKVKLSATVKEGQEVASDNAGLGQVAASGQYVLGIALEKGESGQIISVFTPTGAKA